MKFQRERNRNRKIAQQGFWGGNVYKLRKVRKLREGERPRANSANEGINISSGKTSVEMVAGLEDNQGDTIVAELKNQFCYRI